MISESRHESFPMLICRVLEVPAEIVAGLQVYEMQRAVCKPSTSRADSAASRLTLISLLGIFPGATQGVICG